MLKIKAHQKPSSVNPGTNHAVNKTNIVFTTNRKSPNVTIVIGIVNITNTGFINTLRTAKIPATTIAIKNPSTCAPGKTVAQIKTAIAESKSLIIKLFILNLGVELKRYENPVYSKKNMDNISFRNRFFSSTPKFYRYPRISVAIIPADFAA